uniref:Scarecrow-like protein 22 n=1 Tax=Rhizophora mucronata TaxID=61149 RepID=A0A2P2NI21_RHIMU
MLKSLTFLLFNSFSATSLSSRLFLLLFIFTFFHPTLSFFFSLCVVLLV